MLNLDKIARNKMAMLVSLVLLTILTTIALYYTMTVSNVLSVETGGDPITLNFSMVIGIIIGFMWLVALILFYEFKTDLVIKEYVNLLNTRTNELEEFKQMVNDTMIPKATFDEDVLKEGGITGHKLPY